ncbi:MAG: DUF1385 domain-containing protein [Actinomycetota bacterium]
MMRGRDTWAVAVRRPTKDIYVESHPVHSWAKDHPLFRKPLLRGVAAMADALSIGMRAMSISANQAVEDEEKLSRKQMGFTVTIALTLFIAVFVVLPRFLAWLLNRHSRGAGGSIVANIKEGVIRLAIFLGYLLAISFLKEIRRVFQYHGAEHKTIAAYEAGEPVLSTDAVDRYSTIHVRCGTNFLIMTMILTIVIYTFFGNPPLWLGILERIGAIFVIAGIAYEGLRLGAAHLRNPLVRAMMAPGLWLQKITTRPPEPAMIEVAIRSFEAVLPDVERARVGLLPSPVITGSRLDEDATRLDEEQPGEP